MAGVKQGRVDGDYTDKFTGKDPLKQVSWEIAQKRLNKKNTEKAGTVSDDMSRKMPPDKQIYQELDPEKGEWKEDK